MDGLTDKDRLLIAGFLEKNYAIFQTHLDEHDIEPTEAELIITQLKHK